MPSTRSHATVLAALGLASVGLLSAVAPAASASAAAAVQPQSLSQAQSQSQAHGVRYGYVPISPAAHGSGIGPLASSSPWGGYAATGSGFTSITGSWTEPAVTCNSRNNLFAPWVGIDGYGSQTVEQTGVETSCSSGRPVYRAWYEMYPAQPVYLSNPVSVGDSFTGTVTTTAGSGSYRLTLVDNTKGWSYTTTQRLRGANVSAEAIIESPTQSYPSFNAVTFTGITVNGNTFSAYRPIALASGQYVPTALNGGTFSLIPG
ncbi:G1 family glutamic endopeptidase [Streptacidiphilus cavernicola]|uniref:G1 family glutamic endopeptidase n=1 Tax=Streptacidiphilus cavernicola TaxID=3342716 RepID=A0ABV6VYR7_9ACTN